MKQTFAFFATRPATAAFDATFLAAGQGADDGPYAGATRDTEYAGHHHSSQPQSKEGPQQLVKNCQQQNNS